MIRRTLALLAVGLAAGATCAGASPAVAGVYGDELTKCVVSSTTQDDRNMLMRWFYAAISTNPAVKDLAKVTDADREANARNFVALTSKLLLETCRSKTIEALRYEGTSVIEKSFGALGEVAGRGLFSDPATAAELGRINSFSEPDKWKELAKEAGLPLQPGAGEKTK